VNNEARTQLTIAIEGGRCGELVDFDVNTGQIYLEQRDQPDPSDVGATAPPG
jgi:hypothetical protein